RKTRNESSEQETTATLQRIRFVLIASDISFFSFVRKSVRPYEAGRQHEMVICFGSVYTDSSA
ncbi:MAG: hypothetical protein II379_01380, partial [Oscillospiraceae bacterium]|nr:hypothetical protein [Oscillospiraceae bacterium]